jgi:hypothetical protein
LLEVVDVQPVPSLRLPRHGAAEVVAVQIGHATSAAHGADGAVELIRSA